MLRISFPGWTAAFSERGDGDLRVSARSPGEPVAAVRARVLGALGVEGVVAARQVHGSAVVVVAEPVRGYVVGVAEGDVVATAWRGQAAAVHVADCVPIAIAGRGAVAMVHAGWRGLGGGVVGAGVRALRELGAADGLAAVIGPGAGACCYEVGGEVARLFPGFVTGRLLDLQALAAARLRAAGVEAVERIDRCTICDERFFSHRRDGAASGRQAGFAWLR